MSQTNGGWKEKKAQVEELLADWPRATAQERAGIAHRVIQWCQEAVAQEQTRQLVDRFKQRTSIRDYQDRALEPAALCLLKEALVHAATSRNQQARRFAFIQDPCLRQNLVNEAGMQPFVAQAPLVVAGIATCRTGLGTVADVLISLTQLETTAFNAGLGTCWLGMFEESAVHRLLQLPADWRVAMMMAVGYARGQAVPQPKLPKHQMIWHDEYCSEAAGDGER